MAKQTKAPTNSEPQGLLALMKRHKIFTVLTLIGIVLVTTIGIIKYNSYMHKFSDKDYTTIISKGNKIFQGLGIDNPSKAKYCSYESRVVYGSKGYYCQVEMVGYLIYKNDEQAISSAKTLSQEITENFGAHDDFKQFYEAPSDNHAAISINLSSPFPKGGSCNFYIDTNKYAKDAVNFLPEKLEDNLIAISFTCAGEARKPYFPVTYRQGS